MDAQLGKVLDKLDSKGLTSNTVIVLWGDHGWHLGDHGLWNKHSNFEQATRAPLIIVDPAVNKAVTVNSPVEFLDIFPTLCNLVDVEIPANLDGKSLKTTLTAPNTSVKDYAVSQYPRSTNMGYSIRTQKYRYTVWVPWTNKISNFDKFVAEELYDYENDPLETENLVAKASYASILTTMKAHFAEFKAMRVQTSTVIPNLKSFRVFPNPASNEISMEGIQPNSIVSVFDMTGKMLIRKTTNDNISEISLSELANGTYLVKANSHVEKLIICK
jgi:arylsulfatase A-like enzyme